MYALAPVSMGRGQQQQDDLGTELSIGVDLKDAVAAKSHMKPARIAKMPAFSIVQPFSQTPDAKKTIVRNIQKLHIAYRTVMRFQAFGW